MKLVGKMLQPGRSPQKFNKSWERELSHHAVGHNDEITEAFKTDDRIGISVLANLRVGCQHLVKS